MSRGRRRFIKNIVTGTAGVAPGGLVINAAPADAFIRLFFLPSSGDSPVIPFLRYVRKDDGTMTRIALSGEGCIL